jgi:hypothetical protein
MDKTGAFVQMLLQWKRKSITYSEYVFAGLGAQCERRMRHVVIYGLSGSTTLFNINENVFERKVIEFNNSESVAPNSRIISR